MTKRCVLATAGHNTGLWVALRFFLIVAALATFPIQGRAQSLGSAENFAVLGASTVTNGGASQISGGVGVSPGTAITGFPPGIISNGALHPGDATATQAHAEFATAYDDFTALPSPPGNNLSGTDLGGQTLLPGVYRYNSSANLAGALTFDAQDEPTARFVIQIGTTLITSSSSSVVLTPQNDLEAAIVATLPPDAYTAIIAGKGGSTGVAVAEVYHLP